jgi:hypothetical protein
MTTLNSLPPLPAITSFKHLNDDMPYVTMVDRIKRRYAFASVACSSVIHSGSGRVINEYDVNDPVIALEAAKRGFVKQADNWWWYSPENASRLHAVIYQACLELAQVYEVFRSRRNGSIADLKRAVEKVIQTAQIPPQKTE